MSSENSGDLTEREAEVRDLMDRGLTNQEIAQRLGISVPGVKYHVSQILSKLGIGSRREVGAGRNWVGFAWRAGLGAGAAVAVVALVVLAIRVLMADGGEGEGAVDWDGPVYIESISPSSGTIGTSIEIRGYGFTPGGNDVGFTADTINFQGNNTAYQTGLGSANPETLRFELQETLGGCAYSQMGAGVVCPLVGIDLPIGEVSISVHNRNGTSNRVAFVRTTSPLEVAKDAVYTSEAFQELMAALDEVVRTNQGASYGLGLHESDTGEIYIEAQVNGMEASDLPNIPDEIEGYEVRLSP